MILTKKNPLGNHSRGYNRTFGKSRLRNSTITSRWVLVQKFLNGGLDERDPLDLTLRADRIELLEQVGIDLDLDEPLLPRIGLKVITETLCHWSLLILEQLLNHIIYFILIEIGKDLRRQEFELLPNALTFRIK